MEGQAADRLAKPATADRSASIVKSGEVPLVHETGDMLLERVILGPLHNRGDSRDRALAAFGWLDYHHHDFEIDGTNYSVPDPDDDETCSKSWPTPAIRSTESGGNGWASATTRPRSAQANSRTTSATPSWPPSTTTPSSTLLLSGLQLGEEIQQAGGFPGAVTLRLRQRDEDAGLDELVDGDSRG